MKFPQILLVGEASVFENGKDKVSMFISDPFANSHNHELPKAGDCLRLMANEKVAQVDQVGAICGA